MFRRIPIIDEWFLLNPRKWPLRARGAHVGISFRLVELDLVRTRGSPILGLVGGVGSRCKYRRRVRVVPSRVFGLVYGYVTSTHNRERMAKGGLGIRLASGGKSVASLCVLFG